jgi:hypothetical protein
LLQSEVDGGLPVTAVHGQRGHAEHRGVQVQDVAPVAIAGLILVVGLAGVVALAEADPVDGEGHETRLGHDVSVVVAVRVDRAPELRRAVVAHDRLLAEGAVSVAAEDRGALLPGPQILRYVDLERCGNVAAHVDDPSLLAQAVVHPLGRELRLERDALRPVTQARQDLGQGVGLPTVELQTGGAVESVQRMMLQGEALEHFLRAHVAHGHGGVRSFRRGV